MMRAMGASWLRSTVWFGVLYLLVRLASSWRFVLSWRFPQAWFDLAVLLVEVVVVAVFFGILTSVIASRMKGGSGSGTQRP